MSNKKQSQPYIGKAAAVVEAGSAPPRYQSPPQPGILKQQPPQQHPSHAHSSGGLLKDAKLHPYSSKPLAPDGLKPNSNPNNYTFAPNAPQQGLKPPYSRYPNPNQTGIPKQQLKSKAGPEDDRRVLSRPGGSFENPNFVITRIHKPEEDFTTKAIVHQRSQEELSKSPTPQTQNIIRPHSGVPFHRPARFSDEELLKFSPVDMLKFVRKSEGDNARLAAEQHHHMQMLVNELRSLKETNQRLADDNQELRDLCCFLDDDRQKGRKLAREWQRFGRYTASVMRQEVSAYQNKLRELENKQQELIKDNLELKELCLYLDEERGLNSVCPSCGNTSNVVMRDDGDGSSSSTNADEPSVPIQFNSGNIVTNTPRRSASRERLLNESLSRQRNTFNDQTMQYVRSLEQRVKQLEDEKKILLHKMSQFGDISDLQIQDTSVLTGRPEAVVRALQVLEVREQLERDSRALDHLPPPSTVSAGDDNELSREEISSTDPVVGADMDDGEKALVREMCNVVWRKLEEASPQRR